METAHFTAPIETAAAAIVRSIMTAMPTHHARQPQIGRIPKTPFKRGSYPIDYFAAAAPSTRPKSAAGATTFTFSRQHCTKGRIAIKKRKPGNNAGWTDTSQTFARYIEREGAVETLDDGARSIVSNISDDPTERARFWDNIAKNERHGARIQTRIIAELPHELSPPQRLAALKAFTGYLDSYGLPFTAAIHTPDKHGDQRNFHAHIIYNHRIRANGDHDGKILPESRKRGWIKELRRVWSAHANIALRAAGIDKRYDPRSYAEMGIPKEPTRHLGTKYSALERSGHETPTGAFNAEMELLFFLTLNRLPFRKKKSKNKDRPHITNDPDQAKPQQTSNEILRTLALVPATDSIIRPRQAHDQAHPNQVSPPERTEPAKLTAAELEYLRIRLTTRVERRIAWLERAFNGDRPSLDDNDYYKYLLGSYGEARKLHAAVKRSLAATARGELDLQRIMAAPQPLADVDLHALIPMPSKADRPRSILIMKDMLRQIRDAKLHETDLRQQTAPIHAELLDRAAGQDIQPAPQARETNTPGTAPRKDQHQKTIEEPGQAAQPPWTDKPRAAAIQSAAKREWLRRRIETTAERMSKAALPPGDPKRFELYPVLAQRHDLARILRDMNTWNALTWDRETRRWYLDLNHPSAAKTELAPLQPYRTHGAKMAFLEEQERLLDYHASRQKTIRSAAAERKRARIHSRQPASAQTLSPGIQPARTPTPPAMKNQKADRSHQNIVHSKTIKETDRKTKPPQPDIPTIKQKESTDTLRKKMLNAALRQRRQHERKR